MSYNSKNHEGGKTEITTKFFHNIIFFGRSLGRRVTLLNFRALSVALSLSTTNIQLYFILCKLFTNFLQKKRIFLSHAGQPTITRNNDFNKNRLKC